MTVMRTADAVARLGRGHLRNQLERGHWQRPVRGVVVAHNGPLSTAEQREIALLLCAPGSVLAGATALEMEGLAGFESDQVFVTMPEGARRPRRPGLVTHWSTLLEGRDVHPSRVPSRTRVERSVIDFASWAASDRYARAAVLAAFQQRLVHGRQMHDALDRRGDVLRSGLVRDSVLDAAGGIQSLPEADFDDLVIAGGLPAPDRQSVKRGPDGRYFLDAEWSAYGVSVEIHGLPHHGIAQWSKDLVRANEIVITGSRPLIFTSYVIRHEPGQVLDQLVRALRAGGWKGHPRPVTSRRERRPNRK